MEHCLLGAVLQFEHPGLHADKIAPQHTTATQHRQLAGTLFNMLFNLPKFVQFEMSDPFVKKQEREEPHLSDWDRFARTEYIRYDSTWTSVCKHVCVRHRLAMEEEGEDTAAMDTQGDVWDHTQLQLE